MEDKKFETKVYSVFPACGKTWVFKHQKDIGVTVLDSDSSEFSRIYRKRTADEVKEWMASHPGYGPRAPYNIMIEECRFRNPEFPGNYIEHITENLGKYDYIFVSSHKDVRAALHESGIEYALVYPHRRCLEEWVGRCYLRQLQGTNGFPIKVLVDNWYEWIAQCKDDPGAKDKFVLGRGDYLSAYLFGSFNHCN